MNRISDDLTPGSVKTHIVSPQLGRIEIFERVASTNTLLRERAPGLPEFFTVIASEQTGGRGRRGRSFFSPPGTGLYMSMLLRPRLGPDRAGDITTAAAVAVCEAVENTLSLSPSIKWVNDVFLDGKKICGILTEAAETSSDGGIIEAAIVGIGINVYEPDGGFPPGLRDIAGALTAERRAGLRGQLAAAVMESFLRLYIDMTRSGGSHIAEYRRRCAVLGRNVTVLSASGNYTAFAYGVDERCHLLVERPDGTREALSSGEISIRM